MAWNYNTVDAPALVSMKTWALPLPDIPHIERVFFGALAFLAFDSTWREVGNMTSEETSAFFSDAILRARVMRYHIGMIVPTIADPLPDDMLLCDGSTHDKADYEELYSALPAGMKTETTLTLPDLRGQFLLSASTTRPAHTQGGEEEHTLTADSMPAHTHTTQPHSHTYQQPFPTVANGGVEAPVNTATISASVTGSSTVIVDSSGGGLPHNNMPPYYSLVYAVVAR